MKNQNVPIDSQEFLQYIETSKIFELTLQMMETYLTNWYEEFKEDFIECMQEELEVVLKDYQFFHESVSITKNFNFDESNQDFIYCVIDILDQNGDHCVAYKAVFDFDLNGVDDMLC